MSGGVSDDDITLEALVRSPKQAKRPVLAKASPAKASPAKDPPARTPPAANASLAKAGSVQASPADPSKYVKKWSASQRIIIQIPQQKALQVSANMAGDMDAADRVARRVCEVMLSGTPREECERLRNELCQQERARTSGDRKSTQDAVSAESSPAATSTASLRTDSSENRFSRGMVVELHSLIQAQDLNGVGRKRLKVENLRPREAVRGGSSSSVSERCEALGQDSEDAPPGHKVHQMTKIAGRNKDPFCALEYFSLAGVRVRFQVTVGQAGGEENAKRIARLLFCKLEEWNPQTPEEGSNAKQRLMRCRDDFVKRCRASPAFDDVVRTTRPATRPATPTPSNPPSAEPPRRSRLAAHLSQNLQRLQPKKGFLKREVKNKKKARVTCGVCGKLYKKKDELKHKRRCKVKCKHCGKEYRVQEESKHLKKCPGKRGVSSDAEVLGQMRLQEGNQTSDPPLELNKPDGRVKLAEARPEGTRSVELPPEQKPAAPPTEPPPEYFCCISAEMMREPFMTADGHTYERSQITKWLTNHSTSPKTGKELPKPFLLTPNHSVRMAIATWREAQGLPELSPLTLGAHTVGSAPATSQCCICFRREETNKGLQCSGKHFMCSACVPRYVLEKVQEPLHLVRERNAKIRCGVPGCRAPPWADREIAAYVNDELFSAQLRCRERLREEQATKNAEEKVRAELNSKMERERSNVQKARRYVEDQVLMLKCPKCQQIFDEYEFDGCFVLTCSGCSCRFCAYCSKECGDDLEGHMRQHDPSGDGLFGDREVFERVQLKRREDKFKTFLRTWKRQYPSPDDLASLKDALSMTLQNIGLSWPSDEQLTAGQQVQPLAPSEQTTPVGKATMAAAKPALWQPDRSGRQVLQKQSVTPQEQSQHRRWKPQPVPSQKPTPHEEAETNPKHPHVAEVSRSAYTSMEEDAAEVQHPRVVEPPASKSGPAPKTGRPLPSHTLVIPERLIGQFIGAKGACINAFRDAYGVDVKDLKHDGEPGTFQFLGEDAALQDAIEAVQRFIARANYSQEQVLLPVRLDSALRRKAKDMELESSAKARDEEASWPALQIRHHVRVWVESGASGSTDANTEVVVAITGTVAAVKAAADAVRDFISLNPPHITEAVTVPVAARAELIGKDGVNVRTLQARHDVRVNVPHRDSDGGLSATIEVTVCGPPSSLAPAIAEIRAVGARYYSKDLPAPQGAPLLQRQQLDEISQRNSVSITGGTRMLRLVGVEAQVIEAELEIEALWSAAARRPPLPPPPAPSVVRRPSDRSRSRSRRRWRTAHSRSRSRSGRRDGRYRQPITANVAWPDDGVRRGRHDYHTWAHSGRNSSPDRSRRSWRW